MTISLVSVRILFFLLSVLVSMSVAVQNLEGGSSWLNIGLGLSAGVVLAGALMSLDILFKRVNLKAFNTAIIGLFCGYLMAQAILWIFEAINGPSLSGPLFLPIRFFIYLFTAYLGMVVALRSAEQFHLSIPFIELHPVNQKKKDILLDLSALNDPRIVDLASFGFLDDLLILPRFCLAEICFQIESGDEAAKLKARRGLETLKKLEGISHLHLRYTDTDFPDIKESSAKIVHLARQMEVQLMIADPQRFQMSLSESMRVINLQRLSHSLKPSAQAGETLSIQIQHYGKGARQGVGYLEDGTMVVVNGGAEFLGETIKARVISVKQTMAGMGRMIFCNAVDDVGGFLDHKFAIPSQDADQEQKSYLTL